MAFQLISMPISIIFAAVFVVTITFALWNLRRKGKIYRLMFKAVAVLGVIFLVALVVTALFQGPIAPGTIEVTWSFMSSSEKLSWMNELIAL